MENNLLDDDLLQEQIPPNVEYAGFWIRVGASIIDSLVFIPLFMVNIYNLTNWKLYAFDLLLTLIMLAYKPYMEWKYSATLGKMAVKIKVTDLNYKRISLEQSLLRSIFFSLGYIITIFSNFIMFNDPDFETVGNFMEVGAFQEGNPFETASMVSSIALLVSCMAVAFDTRKQALHDKIAKTYCIYA